MAPGVGRRRGPASFFPQDAKDTWAQAFNAVRPGMAAALEDHQGSASGDAVFAEQRWRLGPQRSSGARPLRHLNAPALHVLRDLRVNVIG